MILGDFGNLAVPHGIKNSNYAKNLRGVINQQTDPELGIKVMCAPGDATQILVYRIASNL